MCCVDVVVACPLPFHHITPCSAPLPSHGVSSACPCGGGAAVHLCPHQSNRLLVFGVQTVESVRPCRTTMVAAASRDPLHGGCSAQCRPTGLSVSSRHVMLLLLAAHSSFCEVELSGHTCITNPRLTLVALSLFLLARAVCGGSTSCCSDARLPPGGVACRQKPSCCR